MTINVAFAAQSIHLACNKGQFAAAASLTNAAAQYIPPSGLATSLALGPGILVSADDTVIGAVQVRFVGDAANVAGQTVTVQLLKNGAAITAAVVAGLATTAGQKTGSVDFSAASIGVVPGDIITATITPSAGLTAVLTNLVVAIG